MQQLRGIKSLAVVARSSSTITTVGQRTGIPEKHHHHQKREKQACIQRDFDGSAPAARRAVHEVEQDARRPPFSLPRRPGPPRAPFSRSASSPFKTRAAHVSSLLFGEAGLRGSGPQLAHGAPVAMQAVASAAAEALELAHPRPARGMTI